jgi:hypothetical protein
MTTNDTRSSATATVRMNARRLAGKRRPISRPPPSGRRASGVDREIDRDRNEHPAQSGRHRDHQSPTVAELPKIKLSTRLDSDDEKEERHQAVVDPLVEVLG